MIFKERRWESRGFETRETSAQLQAIRLLRPGLSFSDVLSRMESLGSGGKIRTWLDNARAAKRYRYITSYPLIISYLFITYSISSKLMYWSFFTVYCCLIFDCMWLGKIISRVYRCALSMTSEASQLSNKAAPTAQATAYCIKAYSKAYCTTNIIAYLCPWLCEH